MNNVHASFDEDQRIGARQGQHIQVLTLEDCVGLCNLSEDEVLAIAAHEHIPEIVAAEFGNYLCSTPEGELCIKAMIQDDIAHAASSGNRERELALKLVLRKFILQHRRCDARHLRQIRFPDRRLAEEARQ